MLPPKIVPPTIYIIQCILYNRYCISYICLLLLCEQTGKLSKVNQYCVTSVESLIVSKLTINQSMESTGVSLSKVITLLNNQIEQPNWLSMHQPTAFITSWSNKSSCKIGFKLEDLIFVIIIF